LYRITVLDNLEDALALPGYNNGQNVMENVDRRKRAPRVVNVLMGGTIYPVTVQVDTSATLAYVREATMVMDIAQQLHVYRSDLVFYNQAGNYVRH